jgi:hypothetical protein
VARARSSSDKDEATMANRHTRTAELIQRSQLLKENAKALKHDSRALVDASQLLRARLPAAEVAALEGALPEDVDKA